MRLDKKLTNGRYKAIPETAELPHLKKQVKSGHEASGDNNKHKLNLTIIERNKEIFLPSSTPIVKNNTQLYGK